MGSEDTKHNGLHCPVLRNGSSGLLLSKVQLPERQCWFSSCWATAGSKHCWPGGADIAELCPAGSCSGGAVGSLCPCGGQCCRSAPLALFPAAPVRRGGEQGCPEVLRCLRVATCVVCTTFLKFLPLLSHEEITSLASDWRGTGWQFPHRCFG